MIVPVDAARPVGAPFPLSTRLFLPTTVPVSADRPDAGETSTLPHYSSTRKRVTTSRGTIGTIGTSTSTRVSPQSPVALVTSSTSDNDQLAGDRETESVCRRACAVGINNTRTPESSGASASACSNREYDS